jgi:putative transposase
MSRRKQHSSETKLNVVLEVLREEQTVNEIAARYGVHPNMVGRWKQEFLDKAPDIFKRGMSDAEKELREERVHVEVLERKVGQLTYEVDWLKKKSEEILGHRPTPPNRRQI